MGLPIAPILIGAGVGALGGALTGNNPFKTALLGGALGTGIGALGAGGAAAGAGTGLATGTGSAIAGTGIPLSALGGASFAPEIGAAGLATGAGTGIAGTGIALAPSTLSAGLGEFGIAPTVAGTTGAGMTASDLAFNPSMLGGSGLGSVDNLAAYANMSPDKLSMLQYTNPSLWDKLKPYATINNLSGAAQIASQFRPTPPSPAQAGHVTQGQAPQGGLGQGGVEGLLAELEKQRQTQRQPISLLVG